MINLYSSNNPWKTEAYEIASKMNSYWINFIKTGNPNGKELTTWKASDETPLTQRLGNGFGAIDIAEIELTLLNHGLRHWVHSRNKLP
jgi:carboxylesterase 2